MLNQTELKLCALQVNVGTVTHLLTVESGCLASIALDGGGALHKHIDHYGGGGGNFHHPRVLRDAPTQMEITA